MENNDNMDFKYKMIDYVRQWRQLSVSIPLVDNNWLKETIRKKGSVIKSVNDQSTVLIDKDEKFIFVDRFKIFNEKHINLKDNWINESIYSQYYVSKLSIDYDMEELSSEFKKSSLGMLHIAKDDIANTTYKSIWDLAVHMAYNECKKFELLQENESLEEWRKQLKDQSSLEYSACHKINMSLNESSIIFENLLSEMGVKYNKAFCKNIDENGMTKTNKTLQDIYYLLKIITEYKEKNQRKWKEYDSKRSFGRSFLKEGKGGLAFFIKNSLQDKCQWYKCINQEYSIIGLLSSLFVIPRMLESELYWNSVDFEKKLDAKFEFVVKKILLNKFPKKSTCQRSERSIESFEETDYSLLDDVYWFISIRQLKDFFVMDENQLLGRWSEFSINAIDLLTIIENMDNDGIDIGDNGCIKSICVEYISKNHYKQKKESLDRKIRRGKELYEQLYDFYNNGLKIFRDLEFYECIFDKTLLVHMIKNRQNKISEIKKTYIKSVMLIIYIVMGKEKVIPKTLTGTRLEEKYSLVEFINLYKTQNDKKKFLKNPVAHFFWEFLNDRIEWGQEIRKLNEFRQTIMVPYLLTYTGLRNNNSTQHPFSFNEIIDALIPGRSRNSLDRQIEEVHEVLKKIELSREKIKKE